MFTTPLGVRPEEIRDGQVVTGYSGTTPRDMRHALAGLVTGPGVLSGLTVKGSTEFEYVIAPGHYAAARPDNGGIILGANDFEDRVATDPAPGTGSRIDIIYIQTGEWEGPDSGATSMAYPFVAQGTASGTPVAPTLPVGAIEIARKVVAAGDVNTNTGAPITYTNTPVAGPRGTATTYVTPGLEPNWAVNPSNGLPRLYRTGPLVTGTAGSVLRTQNTAALTAGAFTNMGTVPAGYRPVVDQLTTGAVHYGSPVPVSAEIRVQTTGVIQVRPSVSGTLDTTAGSYVIIPSMTWPVA